MGAPVIVNGIPVSSADWDEACGAPGSCQVHALRYVLAHLYQGAMRAKIVEKLEAETGVKRPASNPEADEKDQTPISEQAYKNQLVGAGKVTEDRYAEIAQEVCEENPLHSVLTAGGRAKLGKTYIEAAEDVIENKKEDLESICAKLAERTKIEIPLDENGVPDVETLGRAIKANLELAQKEAAALAGL